MIGRYVMLEDQLTDDYKEIFAKIKLYTTIHEIDENTCNEMLMDLLDMLLEAQKNGDAVESIVGEDVELFCHNYFSEYNSGKRLKSWGERIYRLCWYIVILEMIFFVLDSEEITFMQTSTDILPWMIGFGGGAVIGFVINLIFKKIFSKKVSETVYFVSTILAFILFVVAMGFLPETISLCVPLWTEYLVVIGYIVIYKMVQLAGRYRRTGSLKKENSEYQATFGKLVMEEVEREWDETNQNPGMSLAKEFLKQYEKMNKRRMKRGKNPFTEDEFHARIVKNNRTTGWSVSIGLVVGIAAGWWMSVLSYADSLLDGIWVFLLLEAFAIFICRKLFLNRENDKTRKLLNICEERDMNIIEYARLDEIEDNKLIGL